MNTSGKRAVRIVILLLAAGFLTAGILTNGFSDVRSKAVTICMECIGIG